MAAPGGFVDGEPDFAECYITSSKFSWFVLRGSAFPGVFVDGGLDFAECYITLALFWILIYRISF